MFHILHKKKIERYVKAASSYDAVARKYFGRYSGCNADTKILYSTRINVRDTNSKGNEIPSKGDRFQKNDIKQLFAKYDLQNETLKAHLDDTLNLTFVDMLIRYINMRGWRDSKVYKAAQIDRRLFSKIMSDRRYKPSKDTALALAIALKLTLEQTDDLLDRAGYTLSHSDKRDVIIEYFIHERIYNLADINEVLYKLDQKIIGR